jgi:hypothetical protein
MGLIHNDALERIAAPDLSPDTLALLRKHGARDDVVFLLGRLAWQGDMKACVPDLFDIAIDPSRGRFARVAAIRAVMAVGDDDRRDALWMSLADSDVPVDRRLLAEVLQWAAPTARSIDLLRRTIERLAPEDRHETTGQRQALHGFVDRLAIMADTAPVQPLAMLVDVFNDYLDRPPFVARGECHVSEAYAWLMPAALHAVDRLVGARAAQALGPGALAVMMKLPALRFWRGEDMREFRSTLAINVPRWREVNDALYWRSIAERREHLAAKGERLVDDWPMTITAPFWSFGSDDFDRCLAWVAQKEALDDRLVALSRAVQIYVDADRPRDWLARLESAVAGQAELAQSLEVRLCPRRSPEIEKVDEKHRRWERDQRARARKQERDRAAWVRTLKDDPNRVRHPKGLTPADFSTDQLHLMVSLPGEGLVDRRDQYAAWRALIPEFGEEVALAFRGAAIEHWRAYRPPLASEGADTRSTPYSLTYAMVGLAIEAKDEPGFPAHVTADEAEHAFRYITWELNGFPRWFEVLFKAFPVEGRKAVLKEVGWGLANSAAETPMHHILHDIVYHAPWLNPEIAQFLHDWLWHNALPHHDGLRYAINIMAGGGVAAADLARLARHRIAVLPADAQLPRWYALWVDTEPDAAIPALRAALGTMDTLAASGFAQHFIVSLVGDRHGAASRVGAFRNAAQLKDLYVLMHSYIDSAEDIDRAGKGVYSPTLRDDAQDARDSLFNMLFETPGEDAYRAIRALEHEHPVEKARKWMARRARQRAIIDADEPLWPADEVREFMAAS